MAAIQGQDVIRCELCPNPVENHCNLCHVDLCISCIPSHMTDKSRKHEIVEYASRKKETVILPSCSTHANNHCEAYCEDCKTPVCILCLMGSHKHHAIIHINESLQQQLQLIISDTAELENDILPKYRKVNQSTTAEDFDKVLSAIEEQEVKICDAVLKAGLQLKDKVIEQKESALNESMESQSLTEEAEKELDQVIQKNKEIILCNDVLTIMNYRSRNGDFRKGSELPVIPRVELLPGLIEEDHIVHMIGFLKSVDVLPKRPRTLKVMDDPVVLSTIQSPFGDDDKYLKSVQCVGRDKILTTGNACEIKQIDKTGVILETIPTHDLVWALSITLQQEPVFSLSIITIKRTEIYIYKQDKRELLFSLKDWYPVGLCYAKNGDLLVSMRSTDLRQSRIVRYSGSTEIQEIQCDGLGQSLLSTDIAYLLPITENINGDICVADYAGLEVVVMDSSGELRFKYSGNPTYSFRPLHIASDVNAQILICDTLGNVIHIIDGDGNFVRYIEHPCYGGLSIDTDHNLVVGDRHSGKIKIIKYLE